MLAGVLYAAVAHQAEVVAVAQQVGELRQCQRTFGLLGRRSCRQTFGGQLSVQALREYSPVAYSSKARRTSGARSGSTSTVRISRPSAKCRTLRYPRGALNGRAAQAGLLGRALEDLGSEVGAVELGEVGHDVAHQLPDGVSSTLSLTEISRAPARSMPS